MAALALGSAVVLGLLCAPAGAARRRPCGSGSAGPLRIYSPPDDLTRITCEIRKATRGRKSGQKHADLNRLLEEARANKEVLGDLIKSIADPERVEYECKEVASAHRKNEDKIKSGAHKDASQMTDLVRGRARYRTLKELYAAVSALHGKATIVDIEDRFANPKPNGYVEISALVRLPSGHVGEIQFHLDQVHEGKKLEDPAYHTLRMADAVKDRAHKSALDDLRQVAGWVYPAMLLGYALDQGEHPRTELTVDERKRLELRKYSMPRELQTVARRARGKVKAEPDLRQSRSDATVLAMAAARARTEMQDWLESEPLTHGASHPTQTGADTMTTMVDLDRKWGGCGGSADRAFDYLHSELRLESLSEIYKTLALLGDRYPARAKDSRGGGGPQIVGFHDSFDSPPPSEKGALGVGPLASGRRQLDVYVRFSNGHVGTLSLRLGPLERMWEDLGHRFLLARANTVAELDRVRPVAKKARRKTRAAREREALRAKLGTLGLIGEMLGEAALFLHAGSRRLSFE